MNEQFNNFIEKKKRRDGLLEPNNAQNYKFSTSHVANKVKFIRVPNKNALNSSHSNKGDFFILKKKKIV